MTATPEDPEEAPERAFQRSLDHLVTHPEDWNYETIRGFFDHVRLLSREGHPRAYHVWLDWEPWVSGRSITNRVFMKHWVNWDYQQIRLWIAENADTIAYLVHTPLLDAFDA